jgi:hypothetical protein
MTKRTPNADADLGIPKRFGNSFIADNTLVTLDEAAELFFPRTGVSGRALYKMHKQGLLICEYYGRTPFTTRAYIEEMRKKCRVQKPIIKPDCGSSPPNTILTEEFDDNQIGASSTDHAKSALAFFESKSRTPRSAATTTTRRKSRRRPENVVAIRRRSGSKKP